MASGKVIPGCLHRYGSAVPEPIPSPHPRTLFELRDLAVRLLAKHQAGGPHTFDLSRLQRALLELILDGPLTPVGVAIVLDGVLAPMDGPSAASLALCLVHALRHERLHRLARGALLVLRDAILLEEAEVGAEVLTRLDAELVARNGGLRALGSVALVADQVEGPALEMAIRRARGLTQAMLLVGVPAEEQRSPREVLLEHVRIQARRSSEVLDWAEIERWVDLGRVHLLTPARLEAERRTTYSEALRRALSRAFRAVAGEVFPVWVEDLPARPASGA